MTTCVSKREWKSSGTISAMWLGEGWSTEWHTVPIGGIVRGKMYIDYLLN